MSDAHWSALALHRAYDRTLPHWHAYCELVAEFTDFMRPATRILDAGCGTGMLAEELATAGRQVEGVDLNAEMIRAASERTDGAARLCFSVQDVTRLPHANESFDGAVSSNVIFAVDQPELYLSELRRVLRVGARLAICGPTPRAPALVQELFEDLQRDVRAAGQEHALENELGVVRAVNEALAKGGLGWTYSASELGQLLSQLGFRVELQHERLYRSALFFVAAIRSKH